MEYLNNEFIESYINSGDYGFYKKDNYDFFSISFKTKDTLIEVIDKSNRYHNQNKEISFYTVIFHHYYSFI